MKGTPKQTKWAEDIRSGLSDEVEDLRSKIGNNEEGIKALDFILDLEDARFWIDHRNETMTDMMRSLFSHGLRVKGLGFSHTATIKDARITTTWQEIVADGKGGHKETRSVTV